MNLKKLSCNSYSLNHWLGGDQWESEYDRFISLGGKAKFSTFLEAARLASPSHSVETKNKDQIESTTKGNETSIISKSPRIKTLDDLIKACDINLDVWIIENHKINKWEVASQVDGKFITEPLYQVSATLKKKIPDQQEVPTIIPIKLPEIGWKLVGREYLSDIRKVIVFGDAQIGFLKNQFTNELTPMHDERALGIILSVIKNNHFDEIVINGDMLDLPMASSYIQKPEFAFTLQPAINYFGNFLLELRKAAPSAEITYLLGNHCKRLEKQIIENFTFAYGLKAFNKSLEVMGLRNLLDLDSIGIRLIEEYPGGQYWITDDLVVKHGEFTTTQKELNTTTISTIMGHLHTPSMISKTIHSKSGKKIVSVVCSPALCSNDGVVPGVSARPQWINGFTTVTVNRLTDKFQIQNHLIEDNSLVYNDKEYI